MKRNNNKGIWSKTDSDKINNRVFGPKEKVLDKLNSMSKALSTSNIAQMRYAADEDKAIGMGIPTKAGKLPTLGVPQVAPFVKGTTMMLEAVAPTKIDEDNFYNHQLIPQFNDMVFLVGRPYQFTQGHSTGTYNATTDAEVAYLAGAKLTQESAFGIALAKIAIDMKSAIIARNDSINPFYTLRTSEIYDMLLTNQMLIEDAAWTVAYVKQLYALEDDIKLGHRWLYNQFYDFFNTNKPAIQASISQLEGYLYGKMAHLEHLNEFVLNSIPFTACPIKDITSRIAWPYHYYSPVTSLTNDAVCKSFISKTGDAQYNFAFNYSLLQSIIQAHQQLLTSAVVSTVQGAVSSFTIFGAVQSVGAPGADWINTELLNHLNNDKCVVAALSDGFSNHVENDTINGNTISFAAFDKAYQNTSKHPNSPVTVAWAMFRDFGTDFFEYYSDGTTNSKIRRMDDIAYSPVRAGVSDAAKSAAGAVLDPADSIVIDTAQGRAITASSQSTYKDVIFSSVQSVASKGIGGDMGAQSRIKVSSAFLMDAVVCPTMKDVTFHATNNPSGDVTAKSFFEVYNSTITVHGPEIAVRLAIASYFGIGLFSMVDASASVSPRDAMAIVLPNGISGTVINKTSSDAFRTAYWANKTGKYYVPVDAE